MAGWTERERELREKRAQVRSGQLPIVEKLNAGEKLTVEEAAEYTKRDKKLTKLENELEVVMGELRRESAERNFAEEGPDTRSYETERQIDQRQEDAFSRYLVTGERGLNGEQRSLLTSFAGPFDLEHRAGPGGDNGPMQTGSSTSEAGYLVPQGFWHHLQIARKAYGGVYPHFEQVNTDTGNPMPWPTTDPTSIVAYQLTENAVVTPQDVVFGQGMLNAWTFVAGPFFASIQIVNDSAFSVDAFLRARIAEAIGRAQAAAAWSGTGSSQPEGLSAALTTKGAASIGTGGVYTVPAARALYTLANQGTATTELAAGIPSFQSYLDLITMVDPAYRIANGDAAWYMNDLDLQHARSVTDTFGHPLWQPSVQVGGNEPGARIEGYPVIVDNNAPGFSKTASTQGGPVFGSLTHAMVARNVRQAGVMVLRERYADYLAVAWLGFMRFDSRSNDMRAVATFKTNAT
jgi:HK97 family phage major capsid protein